MGGVGGKVADGKGQWAQSPVMWQGGRQGGMKKPRSGSPTEGRETIGDGAEAGCGARWRPRAGGGIRPRVKRLPRARMAVGPCPCSRGMRAGGRRLTRKQAGCRKGPPWKAAMPAVCSQGRPAPCARVIAGWRTPQGWPRRRTGPALWATASGTSSRRDGAVAGSGAAAPAQENREAAPQPKGGRYSERGGARAAVEADGPAAGGCRERAGRRPPPA